MILGLLFYDRPKTVRQVGNTQQKDYVCYYLHMTEYSLKSLIDLKSKNVFVGFNFFYWEMYWNDFYI